MRATFDVQGHRGARGLKPENTLPSFEAAFDLGVTSVETDVHLTRDGVAVLYHDHRLSERLCHPREGLNVPDPRTSPLVSSLTLDQLQGFRACFNPDPARFPTQDASVTPLARRFADRHGIDPYSPPTLTELFAFASAYAGDEGNSAGKAESQRQRALTVSFDLELKRVPFHPEYIGDQFDGFSPGRLEQCVVEACEQAALTQRTIVRSFDHRSVRVLKQAAPRLRTAVLVGEAALIAPERLVLDLGADTYCPEYTIVDSDQIERLHAAGVRVVPWTVNDLEAMRRLLDWGVDGITTDYPDRLVGLLKERRLDD